MARSPFAKGFPEGNHFASYEEIDPELQDFLEAACLQLCEWFSLTEQVGPLPPVIKLPEVEPELYGISRNVLLADLQLIMEGSYRPSHPGSLAHLDPPPLIASIVGDLISAGINNNLLAEELSPSLSRLERKLCKWFAKRLGMKTLAGGVAASGGTLSNLMALVVARKRAELMNDPTAVILASEDAHVSITKASRVMGLLEDSLILIPTNSKGEISIHHLERKIELLKSENRKCFAIVGTAGSTVQGAVDPLDQLAEISSREGIWLHVDGSIGGVFGLIQSTSNIVKGIEAANSITLNPQKLLGIAKTSSLLLVANQEDLISTFSTGLPYIEPAEIDSHGGELGLQGTRSAEVLKLWLGIRQLGENGMKTLLEEALFRKEYLEEKLDRSKFNVISGPLHILSCTPRDASISQSKDWSFATRVKLLEHKFMLSRPIHADRYYLKVVLGNPNTKIKDLERLANLLNSSL